MSQKTIQSTIHVDSLNSGYVNSHILFDVDFDTPDYEKHPALTVVVVAGTAHSWKRGIPKQLSNPVAGIAKVVLFEAEGRITRDTITAEEADYLWLDYGQTGWRSE